ncbi:MAG: M48 family metalloprotease [Candidatus Atribacteria bacterium]|nr:M48 family metalloprotease [Candidatus Atribacteria bacterium]
MYENIASNRRRTAFIIVLFIIFIAALGFAIGIYFDYRYGVSGAYSIMLMIFALVFAVIVSFASYYYSDKLVLQMTKAYPLIREQDTRVYYIVEGLSIAAGLPMPKIYVIEESGMNAFTTGRNPSNSVLVLTRGIMNNLDDEELKGVVAHELSHVKNYDILLGTIIVVLVGMVTIISNIMFRSFIFGGGRRSSSSRNSGGEILNLIFLAIGLLLIILSPLIATVIRFAISRQREYLADSNGALITRYPAGLASALRKISAYSEVSTANNATEHMFISNPFGKNTKVMFSSLFNTHPPIEERVRRLEKMSLGIGVDRNNAIKST